MKITVSPVDWNEIEGFKAEVEGNPLQAFIATFDKSVPAEDRSFRIKQAADAIQVKIIEWIYPERAGK